MKIALPICLVLTLFLNYEVQARKWTDITGKFSLEAEFVDSSDGVVTLKLTDGTTKKLPLSKLSEADQQFIKDMETGEEANVSPEELLEDHIRQSLKIKATSFNSDVVKKVISSELFKVNVSFASPNGELFYERERIYAVSGTDFIRLDDANVGGPKPILKNVISKDFRLKTGAEAELLQKVLLELYPINENFVKKDEIFVKQTGNKWSFTRKAFIKKFIGFVFTTDDDGVITDVELSFDIVK